MKSIRFAMYGNYYTDAWISHYPDAWFYIKARIINKAEDVKRFALATLNTSKGDMDRVTVEMSLGTLIDW